MFLLTRLLLTVVTTLTLLVGEAEAADKKKAKPGASPNTITAIDQEAKTITVGGKVVTVDETTVITDSGKPAKFTDLKVGVTATIVTIKLGEKLQAVSVKTGSVAVALPAAKKKK